MDQDQTLGQAVVRRYMDDEREAIFARGSFGALFAAYLDHAELWDGLPDPLCQTMMRQALGGAALYLSSRPRDESVAWTLNVQEPPINLFFTGSSSACTVTGRVYTEHVQTADSSRFYVQSTRAGGRNFTSVVEAHGFDVLLILEEYCIRSDQANARFFELSDDEFLMVALLPVEDPAWLAEMTLDEARERLAFLRPLDERTFWFQCGCSPERMLSTVRTVYEGRVDELFLDDQRVTVSCPRCGRKWNLTRDDV